MAGRDLDGITNLAYDSRRVQAGPPVLFIALQGPSNDGHRYLPALYRQGVRAFMVSEQPDMQAFPEAGFCVVQDTLVALQQLAAQRRKAWKGMLVAIGGSNGKTIVKEWLYQLMGPDSRVHRSPKSFNSQLGVALSLWGLRESHDLALIEAGISREGEMERLQGMICPRWGLFTNLGTAHQENFPSMDRKLEEKLTLFRDCEKVIYRRDSATAAALEQFTRDAGMAGVSWSLQGSSDYSYRLIKADSKGVEVLLEHPEKPLRFRLPYQDEASLENALHALSLALELGLERADVPARMAALEPVSMRLEILEGMGASTLINDSYNADTGGLEAALDLLNRQEQHEQKVLILSDLLQSGQDEKELYREVASWCLRKGVDQFVGIGPALNRQSSAFPEGSRFYASPEDFLQELDPSLIQGAAVLIKGSRPFGFERISRALQLKTHLTRLEIHMSALYQNLQHYRSLLRADTKVMVMVKALSYGSGPVEMARFLQYQQVDYLAVAYIDEGISLRKAGIQLPIMVMNPHPHGFGQMIDFHLEPEVFSKAGLDALKRELRYRQIRDFPIHVKIDTGMHRLGFSPGEVEGLPSLLDAPEMRVASIFSHLVASDDARHDAFTRQQISLFTSLASRLSKALSHEPLWHILNSAGIERFPESQMQMVRLGIGLHGVGQHSGLQQVARFLTTVSQVRKVRQGESIGYGRAGKASEDMDLATLPVGYADGLDRRLGNGVGQVWILDHKAPIVGRVCMDMCMVDVSGLGVKEGDEAELFGEHQSVTEIAALLDTIPYEILTSVPERVKRVYLQE